MLIFQRFLKNCSKIAFKENSKDLLFFWFSASCRSQLQLNWQLNRNQYAPNYFSPKHIIWPSNHLTLKLLKKKKGFSGTQCWIKFLIFMIFINYINCYILKSIHAKIIENIWKFIRIVLVFNSEPFAGLKPSITRPGENPCSNPGGIQVRHNFSWLKKKKLRGLNIHKNWNTNCFHVIFISYLK